MSRGATASEDHRIRYAVANPALKAGPLPFSSAELLRSAGDLVFQMAGLMIAAKMAQRRLVPLEKNVAQLIAFRISSRETLPVNLAQRTDERVSVFAADFAVLVAVAIVEAWLAHAALLCARGRQHPPAEIEWQPTPAFWTALGQPH